MIKQSSKHFVLLPMKKFFTSIVILLFAATSFSQSGFSDLMKRNERELAKKLKELRSVRKNKDLKEKNEAFIKGLKIVLGEEETFNYPFDSLNSISKITSPDNSFRLFNLNVEMQDGSQKFYCFILKKDGEIIELNDKHQFMNNPETKKLTDKNWYGAVYYEIIPIGRKQYTLLGWNGKSSLTTQKLIEVMSLGNKKAKFGASVFKFEDTRDRRRRFILEYANDAYVSMKYVKQRKSKQIVYDHVSPSTPQTEGFYQFYYPDLSYDSFTLEGGKWVHQPLVEPKNNKSDADKLYNDPKAKSPFNR